MHNFLEDIALNIEMPIGGFMKNLVVLLLISILVSPAFARPDQRRQMRQEHRIEKGVKSGQLTDGEAKRLERGQAHIDRAQARAESDGVISKGEEAKLQHMENNQSRRIYRLKHNDKAQPGTETAPAEPSAH